MKLLKNVLKLCQLHDGTRRVTGSTPVLEKYRLVLLYVGMGYRSTDTTKTFIGSEMDRDMYELYKSLKMHFKGASPEEVLEKTILEEEKNVQRNQ